MTTKERIFSQRTVTTLLPVCLLLLALLTACLNAVRDRLHPDVREFLAGAAPAWLFGVAAVVVFLIVIPLVLGLRVWGLSLAAEVVQGADNRPSTSKIQFFWWTITVLFSAAALQVRQLQLADRPGWLEIPPMVFVAMGAAALTAIGAKAIANGQSEARQGAPNATPPLPPAPGGVDPTADAARAVAADSPTGSAARSGRDIDKQIPPAGDLSYAVTDDAGRTDLMKIQLLTWTVFAIVIYLWRVCKLMLSGTPPQSLPDIDSSMVILTGLSQGAYLGRKLVPDNTPWLLSLTPKQSTSADIKVGKVLTITGKNFGGAQGGSMVTLNETPLPVQVSSWSAEAITFVLAAELPPGTAYVGVVVGGQMSANALPLVVT